MISTRESGSYSYYSCHKTSHHDTILRLRDRFGAPSIFPDAIEDTEIIHLIAQTIPHIFWMKTREPPTGRCNLREIVKEIRASSKTKSTVPLPKSSLLTQRTFAYLHKSLFFFSWCHLACETEANPIYTSTTKHAWPSLVSDWGESSLFNP
jgi:hypothetical protein